MIIEKYILPFFEVVEPGELVTGICNDPDDDRFLSCALSGGADYIVSGDKELCNLKELRAVRIISAEEFMKMFE